MSNRNTKTCQTPGHHALHICQLKKKGLREEIIARSDSPGYICHNCNALANTALDLCNPSPMTES